MFTFFVLRGTVTQRRYKSDDAENTTNRWMFADSSEQYAGCTLPFTRNPVFVAVTATVCLVEIVVVERFDVRFVNDVVGTEFSHPAFKAYIDYTALRDNRVGVLRDDI